MLVSWSLFVSCILCLRLPKFQLSPAPKEALDLFEKEFFPTSELIAWTEGFNRSQPYPGARFSGLRERSDVQTKRLLRAGSFGKELASSSFSH